MTSIDVARKIMGDNFFGPEEVAKCFPGCQVGKCEEIQFDDGTLHIAAREGYILFLDPHLSITDMILPNLEIILLEGPPEEPRSAIDDYYRDPATKPGTPEWKASLMWFMGEAFAWEKGSNFQWKLIKKEHLKKSVDSWKSYWGTDQINKLFPEGMESEERVVPSMRELLCLFLLYYKSTGVRLFEGMRICTSTLVERRFQDYVCGDDREGVGYADEYDGDALFLDLTGPCVRIDYSNSDGRPKDVFAAPKVSEFIDL